MTKEDIKETRVQIDVLGQSVQLIKADYIRENLDRTVTSLFLAKAWLGKLIGEWGDNDSPYKDGKKSVADIEPTAERAPLPSREEQEKYLAQVGNIERIDIMRQNIGKISEEVKLYTGLPNSREAAICRTQAWIYLCEARFHLGFELEHIKSIEG